MATREKKARSVTADSPTPSLGSANSGSNSNISGLASTPTTNTTAPTVVSGDSAPTTPTSTRKATAAGGAASVNNSAAGGTTGGSGGNSTSSSNTRGSLSRLKSKQLLPNAGDEPTVEETDSLTSTPTLRATRGGGGALVREDSAGRDSPATTVATKDKDDATNSTAASVVSKDLKKSSPIVARRTAVAKSTASMAKSTTEGRKNRVVTLKRTTLLKRKGKKIIGKPMLGRKVVARRQLVATAKATAGATRGAGTVNATVGVLKKEPISPTANASKEKREEEEIQNTPSLRNGKPRNSDSPVAKRKSTALAKQSESSKSPDSSTSLLGAIKMERRRSGSVSKCSDMTEDGEPSVSVEIKRELLDSELRTKMLDKMAETFNERKVSGAASPVVVGGAKDVNPGQSASGGTLRRSMRQRKSTARDKEDFLSPRGKTGLEIKIEPMESGDTLESVSVDGDAESVNASVAAPLTIDTTEMEVPIGAEALHSDGAASSVGSGASVGGSVVSGSAGGVGGGEELAVGKDPSLSPGELVSEGVSEQSVKECYGEPAFLENNLGIEKDPKLGEIVQERFRCDKVSDESVGANATQEDIAKNATSDNGGGGGDEDDDVVVVVVTKEEDVVIVEEASEPEIKEQEQGTEERPQDTKDKEESSVEAEAAVSEEKEEDEKFEDASSSVGDGAEDVPMQESEVTFEETTPQINKDSKLEEEKMDVTEEEVVSVETSSPKPEPSLGVAETQPDESGAMELDEAAVNDSSLQTDEPAADEVVLEKDTMGRRVAVLIEDDDECNDVTTSSPAIAAIAEESELSAGNSSTKITESNADKRLASSSPPATSVVAATPSKANGEASGTAVTGPSADQSTPNQQTLSRGQQQKTATGTITPKPVKPSGATVTGSGSGGSGKESKPKTRTTKEKSKEDEKTREEKLRQEKLRVEEKVREEKQRAERLEAEKRLKEEHLQRQRDGTKSGLENGLEDEEVSIVAVQSPSAGSKSGGSSPSSSSHTISTADKENKTEPTATGSAALLALGGLNLPAITIAITKKDTGGSSSSDESPQQQSKSELEILPIKAEGGAVAVQPPPAVVLLSKEEKPAKEGVATGATAPSLADTAESRPQRIISKSEKAAAAVTTLTDRKDGGNKSPTALSIIKIENSNGSPAVEASPEPTVDESKPAPTPATNRLLDESDDAAKRKESHLKHLGLLTIRAACEEKQRRAEQKPQTTDSLPDGSSGAKGDAAGGAGDGWLPNATNQSGSSSRSSTGGNKSTRSSKDEYTVSMKTVLKGSGGGGSRGEKRKQQRIPLKMTFQKGKGKGASTGSGSTVGRDTSNGSGASSNGSGYATDTGNNGDTAFYTVHSNELDHHSSNSSDGHSHRESGAAGGRKAHSRSHTTDGVNLTEVAGENVAKEVIQKALVIPEKASSFNVHPERLCWDQCSYCGGKFGLYDTPCHVAAIKSTERQEKILLATLPKITLDSCLCDACYRHVDRKANCPPQKKKSSTVSQTSSSASGGAAASPDTITVFSQSTVSPLVLKVTTNKDGSTSITTEQPATTIDDGSTAGGKTREICAVRQCTAHGLQSLRRKWMVKMKRKIGKQLDINLDQAAKATAEYISICNKHYEQISHLMVCAMCTKPLQRNHVYHMYNNIPQLERLIQEQGISMRLSSSELVVCKLCKYYANLLVKPPQDAKSKKAQFVKDYSRRLFNYRQRVADEQEEQDVQLQTAEASILPVAASLRPIPVDIVISDGDEEEEDGEEETVEMCNEPQQQRYQTLGELFSIGDSSVSVRRRVSNRKSPEVTIVENNGTAQMGELGEITIIPTSKSLSSSANHQRDDNIDMTKVLKSNPNISMRELFPGEEELGVHVNIPFSASSMRTPEGWTKVTSTIQYDDSTRALWEELQKPYGNQSSFLRHLILLEKYFRNGDLVLSPQAKNNATTYSEAVQNRLRSYDNVPSSFPASPPALASLTPATTVSPASTAATIDKTSSIFQQFSSATITIVPAKEERRETLSGRPWRPTLLPYEPEDPEETKTSPLYQTADGRLLPMMVQVMSGGKAYHITIADYNRMCILRREKLLQQQQNMIQANNNSTNNNANHTRRQSQPQPQPQPQPKPSTSAVSPPALRLVTTSAENSLINNSSASTSASARLVQFPNQLLEQNSLIPILGGTGVANKTVNATSKSSSLMVTMTTTVNNNSLAKTTAVQPPPPQPPAMKPLTLPNSTTVFPMMISANTISLPSSLSTSTSSSSSVSFSNHASTSLHTSSGNRPSTSGAPLVLGQSTSLIGGGNVVPLNPFDQLLKGGNMVTQAQLQEFVAAATAANGGGSSASSLMDNSPAQLLSKIPKSLTVIPQQKQRSMSRVSSHEDQNSA
uniref:Uncharacterized protein n=1 Tax=Anopheles farauti TaxID=69004 RepID=A0A182PZB7_9DIPT